MSIKYDHFQQKESMDSPSNKGTSGIQPMEHQGNSKQRQQQIEDPNIWKVFCKRLSRHWRNFLRALSGALQSPESLPWKEKSFPLKVYAVYEAPFNFFRWLILPPYSARTFSKKQLVAYPFILGSISLVVWRSIFHWPIHSLGYIITYFTAASVSLIALVFVSRNHPSKSLMVFLKALTVLISFLILFYLSISLMVSLYIFSQLCHIPFVLTIMFALGIGINIEDVRILPLLVSALPPRTVLKSIISSLTTDAFLASFFGFIVAYFFAENLKFDFNFKLDYTMVTFTFFSSFFVSVALVAGMAVYLFVSNWTVYKLIVYPLGLIYLAFVASNIIMAFVIPSLWN